MDTIQNNYSKTFKITGNWDIQAKQFKEKISQLTGADLKFQIVKKDELLFRVETRVNKKREDVIHIIKKGQPEKV